MDQDHAVALSDDGGQVQGGVQGAAHSLFQGRHDVAGTQVRICDARKNEKGTDVTLLSTA